MSNLIDDLVDTVDAKIIAAADFSRDKNGVSRFLHDRRFVPADFLPTLEALHKKHVLDYGVGVAFSNLFCDYLQDRAKHQVALENKDNLEDRHRMAEANVDFAGLFGSFFFGLAQPPKHSLRDGVSHKTVKQAYPEIYQISRAGQMLDDLEDLALDIEDESTGGPLSPNIILGNLERGFNIDVQLDFAACAAGRYNLPLSESPVAIREAYARVEDDFYKTVSTVRSSVSRNIMESFWRNTLAEGVPTSKHPRIVKKRQEIAGQMQPFERPRPSL